MYFSEISHDADAFRIYKSPSSKMDRMMLDSAAHEQSIWLQYDHIAANNE